MSHFGDYMDGVPVKISEKYKRPPRIELPYGVYESTLRAQNVVENVMYCSTIETIVLSKLKEIRSAKETKKNERRHRLQLLEEAKQKKLDAIAVAEAEEKLKQLSVSEVSYPSTEEISAISPDERVDKESMRVQDNSPEVAEAVQCSEAYPACSAEPEPQLNILQPIPAQSHYHHNNLLDDVDPLQEFKMNVKFSRLPQYNNIETLTYKDFENDTSSPFDNVELKTLNEMELLAQVLQSQKESSASCQPQPMYIPEQTYPAMPSNCATQMQIEGMAYLPNSYVEQPIHGQEVMYTAPQSYPNGYYIPENVCDNTVENVNMYMPNYQYYIPPNQYVVDPNYFSNQMSDIDNSQMPNGTYIPTPYYFSYQPIPAQYPSDTNYVATNVEQNEENSNVNTQTAIKSRSRSVPDIVKELDNEIQLAKQRAYERSHNASPAPKAVPVPSSSTGRKEMKRNRKKMVQLPNPFNSLPAKLQEMCQKIHGMGFPLDRVARVCTLLGENDKKVIEGLLIMGELMDLGFPEDRVSAVLAKHEFNREKALDELVS